MAVKQAGGMDEKHLAEQLQDQTPALGRVVPGEAVPGLALNQSPQIARHLSTLFLISRSYYTRKQLSSVYSKNPRATSRPELRGTAKVRCHLCFKAEKRTFHHDPYDFHPAES